MLLEHVGNHKEDTVSPISFWGSSSSGLGWSRHIRLLCADSPFKLKNPSHLYISGETFWILARHIIRHTLLVGSHLAFRTVWILHSIDSAGCETNNSDFWSIVTCQHHAVAADLLDVHPSLIPLQVKGALLDTDLLTVWNQYEIVWTLWHSLFCWKRPQNGYGQQQCSVDPWPLFWGGGGSNWTLETVGPQMRVLKYVMAVRLRSWCWGLAFSRLTCLHDSVLRCCYVIGSLDIRVNGQLNQGS